jgi:Tfp pilus assembly protein PilF
MSQARIDLLRNLLAQNPSDAFARYGLAMEHARAGDLGSAMAEFRTLLEEKPDYAAAYYHGAQTLEKMGDAEGARELYRRGIEVTTRTGDSHTRSELQAALDLLG